MKFFLKIKLTKFDLNQKFNFKKGFDLLAQAESGSGRSVAFLLPIINLLLLETNEQREGTSAETECQKCQAKIGNFFKKTRKKIQI